MKVLMMSADQNEDAELLFSLYRLQEEGLGVDLASVKRGVIVGMHGYESTANLSFDEVIPGAYDALVLPGGKAPLIVRKNPTAINAVKAFFRDNKPVFAICHGQQVLVSADVLKGRRATCYWNMAQELKDAGAIYEDREVVVDGNLVTSRQPSDLPAFMREMLKALRQHEAACIKKIA